MRIALSQIRSTPSPRANLDLVAVNVATARGAGAEIVVFPEATMAPFGSDLRAIAEPLDGPWADTVRQIAVRHDVVVVVGMFRPTNDGRVFNTLLATGPRVDAHYDKIHLFDAFGHRESDTVAPGSRIVTIRVGEHRVGLATCYDVRFPELFRAHADAGCSTSILAASWAPGKAKRAQWNVLTRARALDAGLWLAAVDQADAPPGAPAHLREGPVGIGYSALVRPNGQVARGLQAQPDLLVCDITREDLTSARNDIAVLANRRLEAPDPARQIDSSSDFYAGAGGQR